MRGGRDFLGQVFRLLDEGVPPLGGTDLLLGEGFVRQLEEVALAVVARVDFQNGHLRILGGALLEEVLAVDVDVVVGRIQRVRHQGRRVGVEQVGAERRRLRVGVLLIEEEVLLEGELVHLGAEGEDAAAVRVVEVGNVLDGVVVEDDVAAGQAGIDAEERADTVVDGVVDQRDLIDRECLADVEAVAAAT